VQENMETKTVRYDIKEERELGLNILLAKKEKILRSKGR
jgi:hypothetical protein